MRETSLPGLLILGTDVIPDVYGHNWGLVVLMNDDRKAIVQSE